MVGRKEKGERRREALAHAGAEAEAEDCSTDQLGFFFVRGPKRERASELIPLSLIVLQEKVERGTYLDCQTKEG